VAGSRRLGRRPGRHVGLARLRTARSGGFNCHCERSGDLGRQAAMPGALDLADPNILRVAPLALLP
jgi:hypothetical protein